MALSTSSAAILASAWQFDELQVCFHMPGCHWGTALKWHSSLLVLLLPSQSSVSESVT